MRIITISAVLLVVSLAALARADWQNGECPMAPVNATTSMDGYVSAETNITINRKDGAQWSVVGVQHMCCQNNMGNHVRRRAF